MQTFNKRDALWTIHDLLVPLLGMYVGQFLMSELPRALGWGLAITATSFVLLFLHLRVSARPHIANGTQMLLGQLIGLMFALDVDVWKSQTPTREMIALWLISGMFVALPVLRLTPQPVDLKLVFKYSSASFGLSLRRCLLARCSCACRGSIRFHRDSTRTKHRLVARRWT